MMQIDLSLECRTAKRPSLATNKGVTLATFRAYVKPGGSVEDFISELPVVEWPAQYLA